MWINIIGIVIIIAYVVLYTWAWFHRDDPFWEMFLNPNRLRDYDDED